MASSRCDRPFRISWLIQFDPCVWKWHGSWPQRGCLGRLRCLMCKDSQNRVKAWQDLPPGNFTSLLKWLTYEGFQSHGGTPSHHPFFFGMFHEMNHPAIGISPCLRKPPSRGYSELDLHDDKTMSDAATQPLLTGTSGANSGICGPPKHRLGIWKWWENSYSTGFKAKFYWNLPYIAIIIDLVGGWPTPLKNMKVSWDYYS